MMETRHDALLRKIDNNSKILTDHNFVVSDYWVKSFYKDSSGKENKEYLVSKKGCEFLAHKPTGEKGVLFTVKYMERFEEMERIIKEQKLELSARDKGILDIVNSK